MLCTPITAQVAAIEALKRGQKNVEQMTANTISAAVLSYKGFRQMGLDCFEPKGAFYLFPSIKKTGLTS